MRPSASYTPRTRRRPRRRHSLATASRLPEPGQSPLTRSAIPPQLVLFAAFVATSILNYAFGLVASRILGPGDFGLLASAQAVLLLAALVLQSGIPWSLTRAIAGIVPGERPELVRGSMVANLGVAALVAGVLALLFVAGPLKAALEEPAILIVVIVTLPLFATISVARAAAQGWRRFGVIAALQVAEVTTKTVAGLALAAAGFGAVGAIAGFTVGGVVAAAMGLGVLVMLGVRATGRRRLPVASDLAPMFGTLLGLALLLNVDLLAVKSLAGDRAVAGHYQAAIILANAPYFLATSALIPPLYASAASHPDLVGLSPAARPGTGDGHRPDPALRAPADRGPRGGALDPVSAAVRGRGADRPDHGGREWSPDAGGARCRGVPGRRPGCGSGADLPRARGHRGPGAAPCRPDGRRPGGRDHVRVRLRSSRWPPWAPPTCARSAWTSEGSSAGAPASSSRCGRARGRPRDPGARRRDPGDGRRRRRLPSRQPRRCGSFRAFRFAGAGAPDADPAPRLRGSSPAGKRRRLRAHARGQPEARRAPRGHLRRGGLPGRAASASRTASAGYRWARGAQACCRGSPGSASCRSRSGPIGPTWSSRISAPRSPRASAPCTRAARWWRWSSGCSRARCGPSTTCRSTWWSGMGVRAYDDLITVSDWLARDVVRRNPRAIVETIPNGLGAEAFAVPESGGPRALRVPRPARHRPQGPRHAASRPSRRGCAAPAAGSRRCWSSATGRTGRRSRRLVQRRGLAGAIRLVGRVEGAAKTAAPGPEPRGPDAVPVRDLRDRGRGGPGSRRPSRHVRRRAAPRGHGRPRHGVGPTVRHPALRRRDARRPRRSGEARRGRHGRTGMVATLRLGRDRRDAGAPLPRSPGAPSPTPRDDRGPGRGRRDDAGRRPASCSSAAFPSRHPGTVRTRTWPEPWSTRIVRAGTRCSRVPPISGTAT